MKAQNALRENKFKDGIKAAKALQSRGRLNKHEQALVLQTLGYLYAGQEKLDLAAKTLQECWDLKSLPKATQDGILYNIGQIYMAQEKPKQAVKAFDVWLQTAAKPSNSALYTIAAANYQIKRYRKAVQLGERAVKTGKRKPTDGLLQLLLSCYVELKQYRPAIRVMSTLLKRHPERRNSWIQLAAMYSQVNDDKRALAVMELAYRAGVLEKKTDFIQLGQRLLSEEIPFKAGKVLQTALKDGKIERNAESTKLIATAWVQSRDTDKAAPALNAAGKLAKDGELYYRLAQLELERENWKKAVSAAEKAIKKGGLKSKGQVYLLIGISHLRDGNLDSSRKAFERASKQKGTERPAKSWIKFLASAAAKKAPGK